MEMLLGSVNNPQRAKILSKQLSQEGVNSADTYAADATGTVSDPFSQMASRTFAETSSTALIKGRIVDTAAGGYLYRVLLGSGQLPRYGVLLTSGQLNTTGAKPTTQLAAGTIVLCVVHGTEQIVTILGALPVETDGAAVAMSSILHQATRQNVDSAHDKLFRSDPQMSPYGAGRLFDTCGGGEYGAITETGLRLHLDSFMATLGLDEASGLYFFYEDMLTRFAAYNYQHWTSVREHWSLNDEGELSDFTGYCVYPWEMAGRMQKTLPVKVNTSQKWQIDEPELGKVEPEDQKAVPMYRVSEWQGFLGQGGKRCVTVYAENARGESGTPLPAIGVADQSCTLAGQITQQTLTGATFVKARAVIIPQQKYLPDDSEGDSDPDYKPNGEEAPKLLPEPKLAVGNRISASVQRLMGIMDYNTYLTNYAHLHTFLRHKKDYNVPEARQVATASRIDYGTLFSKQHVDTASMTKNIHVDSQYGDVAVSTASGSFNMLPDGNFVITGPAGETIRSLNGSIEISAPGDVIFKTGRSVHVLAGRDATVRARNNVELSATEQDVRLKAEKNLQMLAGNSGSGGVVIESRGTGSFDVSQHGTDANSGGVLIRAKNGDCVLHGNNLYARSLGGDIVLDASQGAGNFVVYAAKETVFSARGVDYFFNTAGDIVSGPSAKIGPDGNVLPGLTFIDGSLYVGGEIIGESNLRIAGFGMQAGSEFWGKIQNTTQLTQLIDNQRQFYTSQYPQAQGQAQYDSVFTNRFYAELQAGHGDVLSHFGFSFRTDTQYNAADFAFYETPWEQAVRTTSQPSLVWTEKPVIVSAGDIRLQQPNLYPFPGQKAFTTDGYVQQDVTLYDYAENLPKNRSENGEISTIYSDAEYAEPKPVPLNTFPTF